MGDAVNVEIDLESGGGLAVEVNEDAPHYLVISNPDLEEMLEHDEDEGTVRLRVPLNEDELLWLLDVIHEAKEEA